ncbi:hypothetical protein [Aeromonas salmonicida]|uniref:hypothetical protein n=1 Tax=Aeromonas salmonicida TaxID=645 RepID=UPI00038A2FF6|nr:hypothetical protein [Aeromonas salmonicida]EQC02123.1 deoxyguanosinetriphosphate triphosphohydrolase [Aeromonas salmonicida subsp. pectinolytica 34mel]
MKILSMERLRESTIGYDDYASIALSDHARYIYSAAFRRLQMKAQVFSLESNAAVRSRLTHSIEVAHIGDFLVQKFVEIIKDRKEKGLAISNEYLFFYENEISVREGANKRGNSSRLTQSFHFFMFEPIFSPVNASNQPI